MKNNSMIFDIFQTLLSEEEVLDVCNCLGYKDSSRKFRAYGKHSRFDKFKC